jgi:hypothetical protein
MFNRGQTDETDQIDETDEINQIDETDQIDEIDQILKNEDMTPKVYPVDISLINFII